MLFRRSDNGPFPSSPEPLFQNEGRYSAFDLEIIFHSHANKTHFHKKGCVPSFILNVRVFGTRKWPFTYAHGRYYPSTKWSTGINFVWTSSPTTVKISSDKLFPALYSLQSMCALIGQNALFTKETCCTCNSFEVDFWFKAKFLLEESAIYILFQWQITCELLVRQVIWQIIIKKFSFDKRMIKSQDLKLEKKFYFIIQGRHRFLLSHSIC